jgi:error-prone DNA polymerase
MTAFAELVAATHFSFLRGASHPAEMVGEAVDLGMKGIGIADINTVSGVVRAHAALKKLREQMAEDGLNFPDFRLIVGARLVFVDGTPDIVAYPTTRKGWGRLTRLLTTGNLRARKGGCILRFGDLCDHLEDLLLIVLPTTTPISPEPQKHVVDYDVGPPDKPQRHLRLVSVSAPQGLEAVLHHLERKAPRCVWLGAALPYHGNDARELERLAGIARRAAVPLLATNDALYATPDQRPLQDILTCILEGKTVTEIGRKAEANAERHLKPGQEMARLFRRFPQAVFEAVRLLSRIEFTLDHLKYEYPHEPVPPGWSPNGWLVRLTMRAARERHGSKRLPQKLRNMLRKEFDLIRDCNYAYYFLTVHDVVAFARSKGILCQGRGSAANSVVCFMLGITSVDPVEHDLLFSRFVSDKRNEPPDIDVDFEHERREDVMQYVYDRYGRHRAGIAATVIHYRPRSAVREVCKALGLSEDIAVRLSDTVWGSFSDDMEEKRISEAGFSLENPEIVRLKTIVDQLLKFPRHLSQHVGGFVLTEDRLDETVPIHNAAMDKRTFIEWDKDDIDELKLMKVDVLALGMLTCIRKAFDLMRVNGLGDHTLDIDLKSDDEAVYDMLCDGDSIGVFQVESRAQINMLPRLKPRTLYDLTIQVAIVRPGPIEGDMVHPYLRRRDEKKPIEYPAPKPPHDRDELKGILEKTWGVPLFQEQAMKLAITAAAFTDSEANELRKAMATFRNVGTMPEFEIKMVEGMVKRGYERDFAERCYAQIKGFGSYGFPESHALSFARLVYLSAWIKCHHPAVFACALLNSQPMGFYAPAQIVEDARKHDVEVRPVDVKFSCWDNGLEAMGEGHALRLGFRQIDGFREDWATALVGARDQAAFASIEDLARRASLPSRALRLLADADAFGSLDQGRREALWEVRRIPSGQLPLFAESRGEELGEEPDARLPAMPLSEHVTADYQMTRLSLKGHPMQFLRDTFRAEGVLSCAETSAAKHGAIVRTAGIVLVRQRPGKGNAIFITIEDETGITNILLWARLFESQRRPVMASRLIVAEGEVQKSKEGVVHLMASRIYDRTAELDQLSEAHRAAIQLCRADVVAHPQPPRTRGHPRNMRILPKSRDFH